MFQTTNKNKHVKILSSNSRIKVEWIIGILVKTTLYVSTSNKLDKTSPILHRPKIQIALF